LDKLPAYDTQTIPDQVLPLIDTRDINAFARAALRRPDPEIEEARACAELWHWRSRTRQLVEEGYHQPPDEPGLDAIVRDVATQAARDGIVPSPIEGDFPVFGKAYRALSSDEWALARSIAMERHFALNWVSGYSPGNEWDDTPTDT
jgi:hypothetical protein